MVGYTIPHKFYEASAFFSTVTYNDAHYRLSVWTRGWHPAKTYIIYKERFPCIPHSSLSVAKQQQSYDGTSTIHWLRHMNVWARARAFGWSLHQDVPQLVLTSPRMIRFCLFCVADVANKFCHLKALCICSSWHHRCIFRRSRCCMSISSCVICE